MKRCISVVKIVIIIITASFFVFSCTSANNDSEALQNDANSMVMQVEDQNHSSQLPEGELSKDQVCMVNNAYMGKKQIPVSFENKTYYGCCEMCVDKIKTNKAVRYAKDPLTGKEVDKATAFIALNPANHDGTVFYFESEESFRKFKATPSIH
jgi:YHS domain-containing protein